MTLDEKVQEIDSIKNDIVTCHTNLGNVLTEKGVEILPTDKMLTRINKIRGISVIPPYAINNVALLDNIDFKVDSREAFTVDGNILYNTGASYGLQEISIGNKITSRLFSSDTYSMWFPYLCINDNSIHVLFCSLKTNTNSFNKNVLFDKTLNTFSEKKDSPKGKLIGASCCLIEDNIYIFGGCDGTTGGEFNTVYSYNITSDTYTSKPVFLDSGRSHLGIAQYANFVYLLGGQTTYNNIYGTQQRELYEHTYKYSIHTGTCTQLANAPKVLTNENYRFRNDKHICFDGCYFDVATEQWYEDNLYIRSDKVETHTSYIKDVLHNDWILTFSKDKNYSSFATKISI